MKKVFVRQWNDIIKVNYIKRIELKTDIRRWTAFSSTVQSLSQWIYKPMKELIF